jgi:hypothetical protein
MIVLNKRLYGLLADNPIKLRSLYFGVDARSIVPEPVIPGSAVTAVFPQAILDLVS